MTDSLNIVEYLVERGLVNWDLQDSSLNKFSNQAAHISKWISYFPRTEDLHCGGWAVTSPWNLSYSNTPGVHIRTFAIWAQWRLSVNLNKPLFIDNISMFNGSTYFSALLQEREAGLPWWPIKNPGSRWTSGSRWRWRLWPHRDGMTAGTGSAVTCCSTVTRAGPGNSTGMRTV